MAEFTFESTPSETFADASTRTIKGLAVPTGASALKGGRNWVFKRDSIEFERSSTPLLAFHDMNRPVGKLVAHEWSDRGLEVAFKVSKTSAGDEALQLAADGVLGLSVGIDVPIGGAKQVGEEFHVSRALASEVSLVSIPAFAGSTIDSVDFSKEMAPMAENDKVSVSVAELNSLAGNMMAAAEAQTKHLQLLNSGPVTQPVPATTFVKEEAPYRFDGNESKHNFVQDAFAGYVKGDYEARNRVDTFLSETFVTTGNVSALTPTGYRNDLYVDSYPTRRPLGGLVTGGTLADITPFVVPKFGSAGTLVAPHVEGVEPSLATFTATSMTVNPAALSGKADFTRELIDKAGPQVQQMVWNKMVQASANAAEARIATMLGTFTSDTAIALAGATGSALADAIDTALLGVADLERYDVLAAAPTLFSRLYTARASDGRKLYSAVNPVNADGTNSGYRQLDMNGVTVVQVPSLTDTSYLIERGAVYQWITAPRRLDFDIQVKSVFMGFWQYSAEAIVDAGGIRRITTTG